jgi:hypothetical protein
MSSFRFTFGCLLLVFCLLFFACGSDSTTGTTNPRTITVTIRNLESSSSVHIYFDLEEPSEANLVPPRDFIIAQVFASQIGHSTIVNLAEGDKPGVGAFYTRNVRVTQTSWDSWEAELQWTGAVIIPVGW